jgi:hypothetical protein
MRGKGCGKKGSWSKLSKVKFQVLTADSIKMTVFCDFTPCGLVEIYRYFRGANCLHHPGYEFKPFLNKQSAVFHHQDNKSVA